MSSQDLSALWSVGVQRVPATLAANVDCIADHALLSGAFHASLLEETLEHEPIRWDRYVLHAVAGMPTRVVVSIAFAVVTDALAKLLSTTGSTTGPTSSEAGAPPSSGSRS